MQSFFLFLLEFLCSGIETTRDLLFLVCVSCFIVVMWNFYSANYFRHRLGEAFTFGVCFFGQARLGDMKIVDLVTLTLTL